MKALGKTAFSLLLPFFVSTFLYAQQPPPIPVIDQAMRAQLRRIYRAGIAAGNRPSVFAKVGDSITHGKYNLSDIGCGVEVLARYQYLAPTIDFFRSIRFPQDFTTSWCGIANSFSRDTLAAANGWTADQPLIRFPNPISACPYPDNNPLRCEFRLIQPSIAFIMFGTNDVEENDPKKFRKNLTAVVQETIIAGVVPILSTIPPRLDDPTIGRRVDPYNVIIRDIAETLQVPLWNYWAVLTGPGMINQGMDRLGIHPSVYNGTGSAVFTPEALRYGFNQRNLMTVQILKKIQGMVENNAPADETSRPNFTLFPDPLSISVRRGKSFTFKISILQSNRNGAIVLTLKAHPAGISGQFQMSPTGKSAMLLLNVRSGVATGRYRITVRGTNGTIVRTTTVAVRVHN
jgi:hypothetical protein